MNYLQAILLGIIQGVTEWLPISSSAHLVIAQKLLNLEQSLSLNLYLHIGTLLVIFLVFYKDIYKIIKAFFTFKFSTFHGKLSLFIILGSIPTALIGYYFHNIFLSFFNNLKAIAYALLITSGLLYFSQFEKTKNLNWFHSILIGAIQGFSLIPGISRSGSTISLGLLLGVNKNQIMKFSFLLAIPAVIGAAFYELKPVEINSFIIVSFFTSLIIGYISLRLLLKIIKKGKFHYFSYYCLLLAILLLIL